MIERPLWLKRIQLAWAKRSIVWLSGVRRVGKTTIARLLPDAVSLWHDPRKLADELTNAGFKLLLEQRMIFR